MAKSDNRPPKPIPSQGYTSILFFTFVVMCFGCALLAYECNEYGWEAEVKSSSGAANYPKFESAKYKTVPAGTPAPAGNTGIQNLDDKFYADTQPKPVAPALPEANAASPTPITAIRIPALSRLSFDIPTKPQQKLDKNSTQEQIKNIISGKR